MKDNILSQGKDVLESMKNQVILLEESDNKIVILKTQENRLDKEVKSLEKEIEDKINSITKIRKKEIEEAYDSQLKVLKNKKKDIKDKREKDKKKKVSIRVSEETAYLKEENKQLEKDIKLYLKNNKIPKLVNSNLFHAIYKPKTLMDILVIIITCLIILLIIPCGIYFGFFKDGGIKVIIAIYFITVVFFTIIYLIIQHFVKEKHLSKLDEIRNFRTEYSLNNKKIRLIKKKIIKDKDDSSYELDNYDVEISSIENDETILLRDKKEALLHFTDNTSKVIAAEIRKDHNEELQTLKEKHQQTYNELRDVENEIKMLTVLIAKDYEPYMGKELLNLTDLDAMISLFNDGKVNNISEAISEYKNNSLEKPTE